MPGIQQTNVSQSVTSSVTASVSSNSMSLMYPDNSTRSEGVMSRLGRWVRAINPIRLIDTPVNRAIRNERFNRIVDTPEGVEPAELKGELSYGRRLPYRAKVTYQLLDENRSPLAGPRSEFQHFVDQIAAKFLKIFLRSDRSGD